MIEDLHPGNDDEPLWNNVLQNINFDPLAFDVHEKYPDIDTSVDPSHPWNDHLVNLANTCSDHARLQTENRAVWDKQYHPYGWTITIESECGFISIWNGWLGDLIQLQFPQNVMIDDQIIRDTLQVENAIPVDRVEITPVDNYSAYDTGEVDSDKPIEFDSERGHLVGYNTFSPKKYARFYGYRIPNTDGRVWVDTQHTYFHKMATPIIAKSGLLIDLKVSPHRIQTISTYRCRFSNSYANRFTPDAPTSKAVHIQRYQQKFITLASLISSKLGPGKRINIKFDQLIFVPEDLVREYDEVHWLRDIDDDLVMAKNDDERVYLQKGVSLLPWITTRSVDIHGENDPELLATNIQEMLYI